MSSKIYLLTFFSCILLFNSLRLRKGAQVSSGLFSTPFIGNSLFSNGWGNNGWDNNWGNNWNSPFISAAATNGKQVLPTDGKQVLPTDGKQVSDIAGGDLFGGANCGDIGAGKQSQVITK